MAKGKWKSTLLGIQGLIGHKTAPDWSFLYGATTTKSPQWNVGDRVVTPDGRVFRYGRMATGKSITHMKRAARNTALLITELDAIAVAASIDDKYIDVTFDDSDGFASDGVIAEDELRGGYISIYNTTTVREQRGIIGNTVRANGDTGNTRIYLDAALTVAVAENNNIEVLGNPYNYLSQQDDFLVANMGMPLAKATSLQYFWIQTWGVYRITPVGVELGVNRDERTFVFSGNGSLRSMYADQQLTYSSQIAGFIVEKTASASGSAAPFLNLQINP